MAISADQINNVLRVYGDRIRQSMISNPPEGIGTSASDGIGISAKSRRETIIDDITSNIIEKITQKKPHDIIDKEVFKTLESEQGKPLANHDDHHSELKYKEIDGNDETLNSLSMEDLNKSEVKK